MEDDRQMEEIKELFKNLNKEQLIKFYEIVDPNLVDLRKSIQNKINMLT